MLIRQSKKVMNILNGKLSWKARLVLCLVSVALLSCGWATISGFTLLVALVVFTPARVAFGLVVLKPWLYFVALGLILLPLLVMEIYKLIAYLRDKKNA